MIKRTIYIFLSIISLTLIVTACQDEEQTGGFVGFSFYHTIDNLPINYNELVYENQAGNPYEVSSIQWFISDVTLITTEGKEVILNKDQFCHYIDTNLPTTQEWRPSDRIPTGTYEKIQLTFGLKGEKNTPGQFHELPESNMVWPLALGGPNGGYHYMKLNGFWKNSDAERTPFNFHLGVGQLYNDQNEVTDFVQNWFQVTLPLDYEIKENDTLRLILNMNVNKWFNTPYIYDFNVMGGMTMTNQAVLEKIKGNGANVFTVEVNNN
jgi:hypothetical protein